MKNLKIILINIFILLGLLLILDISLGFLSGNINNLPVSSRYVQLREYSPNLNNEKISVTLENKTKIETTISTDENGFIIGPNNSKDNTNIDIIFMGGSTTENYLLKPQNRFPYLVQELVKSKYNNDFKTLNAGVSGSSVANSNIVLYSKVVDLSPSYVFLMHNVNDLVLLSKTKSYWKAPLGRSIIYDINEKNEINNRNNLYYFLKWIKDNFYSNLYRITKNYLLIDDWFFARNMGVISDEFYEFRENFYIKNKDEKIEIESQFRNALKTFINISKSNGIMPVLMTQPNRIDNKSNYFIKEFKKWGYNKSQLKIFSEEFQAFNKIIVEVATDLEVSFIDLNNIIPKDEEYIYDSVHLTNKGSILAANSIFEFISENLISFE
jgi:hypothetical protein